MWDDMKEEHPDYPDDGRPWERDDQLLSCEWVGDPMIEDGPDNPVTYPPMSWNQMLEWLLAHGYPTFIWPAEMTGGMVSGQSGESVARMLTRRKAGDNDGVGGYVIEQGINGHGDEVAWIYHCGVPMEEWHVYQQGATFHVEPGAEEPEELPWACWPHIAMGFR